MHAAAEAHVEQCEEALMHYQQFEELFENNPDHEGCEDHVPFPEEMAGPYDGCLTCMIREALFAAWPVIEEEMKGGTWRA
jgi:hypothetical protein